MQILQKESLEIAIIDPNKNFGDEGQYVRYQKDHPLLDRILSDAREAGLEIRRYMEDLIAEDGWVIPVKHVIVEIPPGHVQPFHSHSNVDEINMVLSGEVYFIESEALTERDVELLGAQGVLLRSGDAIVSTPGKRHTIANLSDAYAHTIGTLSAKGPTREFKPDWKR